MAIQQLFSGTSGKTDYIITNFEFLNPGDIDITVGTDVKTSPSDYSIEGSVIKFTSVPTVGTNNIKAERSTNISTKTHTYTPGSSITAQTLNDNQDQALFKIEEVAVDAVNAADLAGDHTGIHVSSNGNVWTINDDTIDGDHLKDNILEAKHIKPNAVGSSELADNAVDTAAIADNAVIMAKLGSGALPTDITVASANIVNATIAEVDIADSQITLAKLATAVANSLTPVGTVIWYSGSTAPTGYLKCNGDAIANGSGTTQSITADFSALYAIVGANLPDLRGEFIRGFDDGKGTDSGRGIRTSQTDEFKTHQHEFGADDQLLSQGGYTSLDTFNYDATSTTNAGGHRARTKSDNTNSGGTETRPRNIALLACIKY